MILKDFLTGEILPLFLDYLPGATERELALVRSTERFKCDYQINAFLGRGGYEKAEKFAAKICEKDFPWLSSAKVVGPGFINISISSKWLLRDFSYTADFNRNSSARKRAIVDYSSPNMAKELAVHHMRSTFLGDAMVRILEYAGNEVTRVNHIGDWGAQFGLIIAWVEVYNIDLTKIILKDLEEIYCNAKREKEVNASFAKLAKEKVALLQKGEEGAVKIWSQCVELTMDSIQELYQLFNVKLKKEDIRGESSYQQDCKEITDDLLERGLAFVEGGAILSYTEGNKNRSGDEMAILWRTQEGASLYSLTDLACAKYRATIGDRIIYCVDSRQSMHFRGVWDMARRFGYVPDTVELEHMAFGMMLGRDGRPYKTRDGGTPKLLDLVAEASCKLKEILADRFNDMSEAEREQSINTLAINSIKYNDLSRHRETNYIFDFEQVLSTDGNTAPYLMYSYVRAKRLLERCSLRHEEEEVSDATADKLTEIERELLIRLAQWGEIISSAVSGCLPHLICNYLYQLVSSFSRFYETSPILKGVGDEFALRRRLTSLFIDRMEDGLGVLGLIPLDRM